VAELLLDHHAEVNSLASDTRNERSDIAATPLLTVVARDDQNLAELLLAHGANPNATNAGGYTPLHFAARDGAQKLLELLLANKATVDAINTNGETPLDLAAGAGHTEVASTLLSHGADVNARNPVDQNWKGWTPLIYAVSSSQRQTTGLLLKNKADPNAITQNQAGLWTRGNTPLLIACKISGESETVAALLDAKADPNLKTDFRWAPARAAIILPVLSERERILSLLLDHGADIETRDSEGKTLLMLAVELKDKEIVDLLLAHKADVNAKTEQHGITALDYTVFSIGSGQSEVIPDIVKALLDAGANPNLQSNEGKTALNYLVQNFPPTAILDPIRSKVRELLIAHGAILDLPRLDAIEVRRPDARFSKVIFSSGTNGWDQFTLFDLIGVQYQVLTASPGGETRVVYRLEEYLGPLSGRFAPGTGLDFPDFKQIRIRRLKPDFQTRDERNVDIDAALASGDCSADVPLQLGDQVEIREADHVLNAKWDGFDERTLKTLKKCLTRQVSIIVKGQSNNVSLGPDILFKGSPAPNFPNAVIATFRVNKFAPLMVKPALIESKLLLASSDLAHIKLVRADPATGEKRELIVDCTYDKPAPSVWLRDGDVIEVPDKP
jgi:ankyrin repeat protein